MRYHRSADNEGYFYTLPEGNGYIEIISYDKLLRDAKRRNRDPSDSGSRPQFLTVPVDGDLTDLTHYQFSILPLVGFDTA
jgi:hypothetical protein